MNLYEQAISLWRQIMSKGVGEHLSTFAHLSVLTGHMCRWKLLQRRLGCKWSISGLHQGQATYTTSVSRPWVLVVAKVWKRRILLLSLLLPLFLIYISFLFRSLFILFSFSLFLFFQLFCWSKEELTSFLMTFGLYGIL